MDKAGRGVLLAVPGVLLEPHTDIVPEVAEVAFGLADLARAGH